ncbi:major tail protein [Actinomycetia phage DSL-LC01]|nr:major tail protein [Actinomycetia phage DSL-LC01]
MPTQDYAASIQGVSIRVTRLDASGTLLNNPGDSYTTSGFMRLSFTPEYEEGDEITEKNANGAVCVTYKSPDTLKRITMEVALCEPDPELTQMMSGGLLLRKNLGTFVAPNNKSIGWASPAVGDDPSGYGVSIECWSHAIKEGKKAATLPYFHWVFPYCKLRQSGDRVIENGMLATTFEGYGLGNTSFASGPDGRWEYPVAAERPYSYARGSWAPTGLSGFYTWNSTTGAYTAVSDFTGQGSTTSYNVPGSEEFNADNPVDFIIASNEDPVS